MSATLEPEVMRVSKPVLLLLRMMVQERREIRIEGLSDLKSWRGKAIAPQAQFMASDSHSGESLAFLSLTEKEQFDLLLEGEARKAGKSGKSDAAQPIERTEAQEISEPQLDLNLNLERPRP